MFLKSSRFALGAVAAAAVAAGFWTLNRQESAASVQSTDDAYVMADLTVIAPQVAGLIGQVAVQDNQLVQAGDLLVGIDDRDLVIALDNAKARIRSSQAAIESLQAQVSRQRSVIAQSRAAVDAAKANLVLAEANRSRFANLARDGSGTVQAQQQAEAQWEVQKASQDRDVAALQAAEQQTAIIAADLERAQAALQSAQADRAAAELNVSRSHISAPVGGVITQRRARVGAYVRVGEPLVTLVPLDAVYVEANFRETQLARIAPGQSVSIDVDALPGVRISGVVKSVGPASGSSLSQIPAHNATGNFTKIVQRLPVRIQLDPTQDAVRRLRVGMSVRPAVDVTSVPVATLEQPPAP